MSLDGPDDLHATIIAFIGAAKERLDVAVQELDSREIAKALIAARMRKVRVRLILEGDYLWDEGGSADPWAPATKGQEENRTILAALLRAGIDVISDLNPKIFHQKFAVRDPEGPRAAVLTGSTNFTLTDTGANTAGTGVVGNNLNHLLILHGKTAAGLYQAEFDRLRSGTFGAMHERVEPRPTEFGLGGIRVKPLFAPRHGPEMEIMKQMLKSARRIDFAMFTFANSSGIDDTMLRLVQATPKVAIRGVLDRGQGMQKWAPTQALKNAGVELHVNSDPRVRKVHHKLMVIDEQLVILGSFNYTEPATTLNDENIVVLGDLEEDNANARTAQGMLATYALTEIDRIIGNLSRLV